MPVHKRVRVQRRGSTKNDRRQLDKDWDTHTLQVRCPHCNSPIRLLCPHKSLGRDEVLYHCNRCLEPFHLRKVHLDHDYTIQAQV